MRVSVTALALALLGCTGSSEPGEPRPAPSPDSVIEPEPKPAPSSSTEPARPEPEPKPVTPTPAAQPPPTCLLRLELDSDRCVLAEQRRRGGAARWNDFPRRYPARYLDPDADHPVELVARYEVGETPLLWFTPDYAEATVNAAVLSELTIVDATGLRVGQRVEIGALTELGLGFVGRGLSKRELALFLLEAGVVQTFVHIGARVCLVDERDDEGGGYRARFIGEHEYYTNEANLDPLGFSVEIAADGSLAVVGTEALPMPAPTPTAAP